VCSELARSHELLEHAKVIHEYDSNYELGGVCEGAMTSQ
jgi:hypothetical protein